MAVTSESQVDLVCSQPVPLYCIRGSVALTVRWPGSWVTDAVGIGDIACVVVTVIVGGGSGSVGMSGVG